MLSYLRIRNVAVIDDVELELAPGLNVITGETGAGKSMIVRSLMWIRGERVRTDQVRNRRRWRRCFSLPIRRPMSWQSAG
jgi:DNA repair protein RecN (Recombination protein N)